MLTSDRWRHGPSPPHQGRGGRGETPGPGVHPAREQSVAAGKAARQLAPLESHRDFPATASRDPVGLLLGQAESRVPELVPVRHGRMLVSPFAYYRGAALPMAADLAGMRSSGLRVQLCGDAHLSNFGAFASPERRLVFDLNDFDETLPGPFEWDVKRLVASMAVAGRDNGLGAKKRRRVGRCDRGGLPHRDAGIRRHADPGRLVRPLRRRRRPRPAQIRHAQEGGAPDQDPDGQGPHPRQHPGAGETDDRQGRPAPDHQRPAADRPARRTGRPPRRRRCLPVPPPPVHRVHTDPAGLPAPAGRAIHPGPRGPQGRRRRQRRHRDVDLADGTRRRPRAAAAAGQAGAALGAGRLRRPERIPQPGRTCRHRPASDASRQRHLPRLATRPPFPAAVRPTTTTSASCATGNTPPRSKA